MKFLLLFFTLTSTNLFAEGFTYDASIYPEIKPYVKGTAMSYRMVNDQLNRLHQAYANQSETELKEVFDIWEDQSMVITPENFKAIPISFQHAYKIFEDFYKPQDLSIFGGSEKGNKFYSNTQYYIIQSKIRVSVTSTDDAIGVSDRSNISYSAEIDDFKPLVKGGIKALNMNHYYELVLKRFFGDNGQISGNFGTQKISPEETNKRIKFLEKYVKIIPGHWGGINFSSDPRITNITFNKDYTKALVHFSLFYEGGEAEYEFKNNKWEMIRSEINWIT